MCGFRPCFHHHCGPHHGCCGPRPFGPGFCGMPNPFARGCGCGGGNIINVFNGCGGGGCCGGDWGGRCGSGSFANGLASALTGCGCGSEASAWGRIVGGLLGGGCCCW